MSKLDRIQVSGFKSISSIDLSLSSLNVLIGANGAGKSNFIGAFELLNQIVEERLQLFVGKAGGADALLHFGRKTTEEIGIHAHFGRNAYEIGLTSAAQDTLIFSKQYLRQFLAKHSATLYLAVKSATQPPDVGGEIAIQDFGEGIARRHKKN